MRRFIDFWSLKWISSFLDEKLVTSSSSSSKIIVLLLAFLRKSAWRKGIQVTCHLIVLMYDGVIIVENVISYIFLFHHENYCHDISMATNIINPYCNNEQHDYKKFLCVIFLQRVWNRTFLQSLRGRICWLLTSLVKQLSSTKRRRRREFSLGSLWWNTTYTRGLAEPPLWAPRTEILCSVVSL